ncbi:aminotransferase class V-fold PLP-dependent enzyme [Virgibacillus sp. W0430]|uniref:aminotransferase class V-fold PLP-dependent enzyme n=1 Tax=Virgibacillus sp. W0430 TaxID=3391580 RepID=UPI003F48FD11
MIYFDQAASSFPKPDEVVQAMMESVTVYGANPGRGGHKLSMQADRVITETRSLAARLFDCSNPKQCLFYQNATVALNQAIKGLRWERGDRIIASSIEHNALRRPLQFVTDAYGVEVIYIDWTGNKSDFLYKVENNINDKTKLVAMSHSSNVTGAILPLKEMLEITNSNDVLSLVDASQTAGHMNISMQALGIDLLVFPAHKGLLGPQGVGMLLVEGEVDLLPLHHGGTGIYSESQYQPQMWPQKLESGTLNTPGIAGLHAALRLYEQRKKQNVSRETILIKRLVSGLENLLGVTCYGPKLSEERMPIAAFNVLQIPSQEIAMILDSNYNIAVRGGLHCNPMEHTSLNTMKQGVVRASVGIYNTEAEVDLFLQAVEEITAAYKKL